MDKKREHVSKKDITNIIIVHHNLTDNNYQHNSKDLHTYGIYDMHQLNRLVDGLK